MVVADDNKIPHDENLEMASPTTAIAATSSQRSTRSQSFSSNQRVIRSALRYSSQALNNSSTMSTSNLATTPMANRRAATLPSSSSAAARREKFTTTLVNIMPTVRKLSECSISTTTPQNRNYPLTLLSPSIMHDNDEFSSTTQAKMMRLNEEDDDVVAADDDYIRKYRTYPTRHRVRSNSGGYGSCVPVPTSSSSFRLMIATSNQHATAFESATTSSSSAYSTATAFPSSSLKQSFSATCSSTSVTTQYSASLEQPILHAASFGVAAVAEPETAHVVKKANFTQKLTILPNNDLSSSSRTTSLKDPEAASGCESGAATLFGTQLSTTSSGVSSEDAAARHDSVSGRSIQSEASTGIGGGGGGNGSQSDDANEDLNDLIDIIQREVGMTDLNDDKQQQHQNTGFWSNRAAHSDVFLAGTNESNSTQYGGNFHQQHANAAAANFAAHSDCYWSSSSFVSFGSSSSSSASTTTLTELQPAAFVGSNACFNDHNQNADDDDIPMDLAGTFYCSSWTNRRHSSQNASSDHVFTSVEQQQQQRAFDEMAAASAAGADNDDIIMNAVATASASAAAAGMQMMSDNDLMRMWIESLPPAHQLPEPVLSPRLPEMMLLNATTAVAGLDTNTNPPHEISSLNVLHAATSPPQRKKYTLVLDLDETLVHAVTQPLADVPNIPDLQFPIEIIDPNATVASLSPLMIAGSNNTLPTASAAAVIQANIMVYVRPYAIEFLRQLSQHYEIVVFTASKSEYADRVIDYLCDQASSVRKLAEALDDDDDDDDGVNNDEIEDDDDDESTASSSATTASPRSTASSTASSSGYASLNSTNSSTLSGGDENTSVVAVVAPPPTVVAANAAEATVEPDDCSALRCTESLFCGDPAVTAASVQPPVAVSPKPTLVAPTQAPQQQLHEQCDRCVVRHRLYREHCVQLPYCPVYLKDLSRLGRDIERTVIVDNQLLNFALQLDNGIAVRSWHGSPGHDSELKELSKFLLGMAEAQVDDVRPVIKGAFGHLKP